MYITLHNGIFQHTISRLFSTSNLVKNHYEVLNLPRNCTAKEIKQSFIQLSKENHPDVSKRKDAHKKFLEINEAYKVLSKTETRRLYDLGFSRSHVHTNTNNNIHIYREEFGPDPWKDPSFYHNRDRSQDKYYQNDAYYGIKGVKRVSNLTVILICFSIAAVVTMLQVLAIRYSFTFRRSELIRRSNEAGEALRRAREAAEKNGNQVQLEILQQRFESIAKYK